MNVVVWPFCSQIDKTTNVHMLETCGACKQYGFVADRIAFDLRWNVKVVLPMHSVGAAFVGHKKRLVYSPHTNPLQQIHWDTRDIADILSGADMLITNHEFLAIPARVIRPDLKIVTLCGILPENLLFNEAWNRSDLVVTHGDHAAKIMQAHTRTPVVPWKFAYDERNFVGREPMERDIDVLFVQRCSSTNYTHHLEFLEAMKLLRCRVMFTDVTKYLRSQRPDFEYSTPETYFDVLHRSKIAIGMCDNLYGGQALREATRAGCTPVVLDVPCYREFVGEGYPYLLKSMRPEEIATTIDEALADWVPNRVHIDESYQSAWETIRRNLESFC